MKTKENNYAFVDSNNLNLAIEEQGWKLDFKRFRIYLRDRYSVTKAFLFIGYVPAYRNLYGNLRKQGYALVFKPTLDLRGGRTKGNVDAELVLHVMKQWRNYDKAVIVSGDGDFQCLVRYLKSKRKLKILVIPNKEKYSALLRRFLPKDAIFMNGLRAKLEYKEIKKTRDISAGRNPLDGLSS